MTGSERPSCTSRTLTSRIGPAVLSSSVLPVPASSCASQRQVPSVVSGSALRACGRALSSACRRRLRQAGGARSWGLAHLLAVDRFLEK